MKKIILILLLSVSVFYAAQDIQEIREEQTVTLIGKISKEVGELSNGNIVHFEAFKPAKPIVILYDVQEKETVTLFSLWLDKKQKVEIKKLLNKHVKITGKVHYYFFGPSTFPTAAKLEVIKMEPINISSGNNFEKQTEKQKVEVVVDKWNEAHNTKEMKSFLQVFAPKVKFYGKELAANVIIDEKIKLFQKFPNFNQKIVSEISCEQKKLYPEYRCDFTKRVVFGNKQKDFPSYLVIDTSNKEPRIIIESDLITDKNLK